MRAIRPPTLVGTIVFVLLLGTGCSDGSSRSTATTTSVPGTPPGSAGPRAGVTFPPGVVSVWECQDGRRLRLEGDGHWHYEGEPLQPGGADDPKFVAELFRCHGKAVDP